MPELPPVGGDPSPNLEPVVQPIIAHLLTDGTEVIERFAFQPKLGVAARHYAETKTGQDADIYVAVLTLMLMPAERDRFNEFVHRDDLLLEVDVLKEAFRALWGHYGRRPTQPTRASKRGGKPAKQT